MGKTSVDDQKALGFFDFLSLNPRYAAIDIRRMNLRHRFLIEPFCREVNGANVLDLASHDGRWAYAFAAAGAKHVLGYEARQHLIDEFQRYPDPQIRERVRLERLDIFDGLRALAAGGVKFDVVAVFGILYHIMDHHYLLRLIRQLQPKLVIVDSEFMTQPWSYIALIGEDPNKELHGLSAVEGNRALIGIPSMQAMEKMAESLSYKLDWLSWKQLPEDQRAGVGDYFGTGNKRRGSCALRPMP